MLIALPSRDINITSSYMLEIRRLAEISLSSNKSYMTSTENTQYGIHLKAFLRLNENAMSFDYRQYTQCVPGDCSGL